MKKLEMRNVEHGIPKENGEIEVFETKEWNLQDIADKINEIIELLNEKLDK